MKDSTPVLHATRAGRRCYPAILAAAVFFIGCFGIRPAAAGSPVYSYEDAEKELDHFLCYRLDPEGGGKFAGSAVQLQDQFLPEPKPVRAGLRVLLCNPVKKIREGRPSKKTLHRDAHLVCYELTVFDPVKSVEIKNQLDPNGRPLLNVKSHWLCVPTGKAEITDKNPDPENPAIPKSEILDHFACYDSPEPGPPLGVGVLLHDQFLNANFKANGKDTFVCNPVEKTAEVEGKPKIFPYHHKDAHLVCYSVLPDTEDEDQLKAIKKHHKARIHNQFESKVDVETVKVEYLCVPSTKRILRKDKS